MPARPQSGLSSASVVWQAPAEGGIPRYMAIFQDTLPNDDRPGPQLALLLHRLGGRMARGLRPCRRLAAGAGDPAAKGSGQYVYNADEFRYSGTFHRITTRFAPHNLYTSGAQAARARASAWAPRTRPTRRSGQFAPDAPLDQRPYGGTITVGYPYNTIKYTYDRTTNTYLRSVTGEKKETDAATGRIAPKNVIVMRMAFGPLNDGHPGAPRLEATSSAAGPAWISTNGRTIKGTWKKTAITKPTLFYDANGNPVTLTIGQTFVQVLTTSTTTIRSRSRPAATTPPATPAPSEPAPADRPRVSRLRRRMPTSA